MKVEKVNDDDIDVFINISNFNSISCYNKESILTFIKDLILKINNRYKLNLSGFYKVKAYFNIKAGLFLNIIKIDDNEFNNEIDLRIILFDKEKFLFETEEYDILGKIKNKKYYNNNFYVDIDEINNIDSIIDMGRIIYGDETRTILNLAKKIN